MNENAPRGLARVRENLRSLRDMKPLHKRSLIGLWVCLLVLSSITRLAERVASSPKSTIVLINILPLFPVIAMIAILGHYLAREADEYVRLQVVRALLWGAAIAVVATILQSALTLWNRDWWMLTPGEMAIMKVDIFMVVAMIRLAWTFRRSR